MKRLFVIAVLLSCFVFEAGAQERLEPVSEPYDFEILYRSALDKILWKNMPADVPFSFEICPSFTPESALCYDPRQGIFIYVKADRNIWYAGRIYNGSVSRFGLMRVDVREYSCPVSSDVARHFLELFQVAIETAEEQDIIGLDGETYQLWTNGRTKTATCWSPHVEGSNCDRLVKLLYALSAYTQKRDSDGIEALIPEVDSLAESFGKIIPDPQTQNKESAPGYYDDVVFMVVNDFVHHEKHLCSQSDVFAVNVFSEAGKEGRVFVESKANDGDHMHYVAVISPKDTTVGPVFSKDDEGYTWTWISPLSDTLLVVDERFYSDRYTVSYSPEGVSIDYSSLPNRMLEAAGKLFVWRDEAYEESKDVIDTLIKLDRVDFWVKGLDGWSVHIDGDERIYYDLEALRNGKINKYHGWFPWGYGFQARVRRAWYILVHPRLWLPF